MGTEAGPEVAAAPEAALLGGLRAIGGARSPEATCEGIRGQVVVAACTGIRRVDVPASCHFFAPAITSLPDTCRPPSTPSTSSSTPPFSFGVYPDPVSPGGRDGTDGRGVEGYVMDVYGKIGQIVLQIAGNSRRVPHLTALCMASAVYGERCVLHAPEEIRIEIPRAASLAQLTSTAAMSAFLQLS